MVAGRVRFFPSCVRAEGHCRGVPDRYFECHAGDPADLGDAPGRRVPFRPRRRPLGPPAGIDGRRSAVFDPRIRIGLRPQPDGADHSARAVRRRDGRRMGRRRVADDGKHSAARPRLRLRPAAIGVSDRILPGVDRLWRLFPYIGWRGMFMVGVIPALLVTLHPARRCRRSPSWSKETAVERGGVPWRC